MVTLSNGLELAFPRYLAEGLAGAKPDDPSVVEQTPAGLGLHWPRLDADLSMPAPLEGVFGPPRWMAGSRSEDGARGRAAARVTMTAGTARRRRTA